MQQIDNIFHMMDVYIATKYGVESALLLNNIYYWVKYNKDNNKNFHNGKYWTYNSTKSFAITFPYWTSKKIQNYLKKLKNEGLIETGNFNNISWDRTLWYTLTDKGESLYKVTRENAQPEFEKSITPIGEMENPKLGNGSDQSGKSLLNKPYINHILTHNKKEKYKKEKSVPEDFLIDDNFNFSEKEKEAIYHFIEHRKHIKKKFTQRSFNLFLNLALELKKKRHDIVSLMVNAEISGWLTIYEPKPKTTKEKQLSHAEWMHNCNDNYVSGGEF